MIYIAIIFLIGFIILSWIIGIDKSASIAQSLGIGFGAFFGGLGGLTAFLDWRDKKMKHIRYISGQRKKYPRNKLGKDFEIIQSSGNHGWIFLYDTKSGLKHWIKDPETLNSLGFSYADVKTITDAEFKTLPEGVEIGITQE
ncbi:MAG: hypothetical protein NTZ49_03910 [Candidatus Parcubacteria bacterium]|nr:hypothetical protein [Candidatus Parcubacteria bacterium]